MTTVTGYYVYAKTRRGVWHRAIASAGDGLLTQEQCNLDDANRLAWKGVEPDPTERRCKHCYRG